ncbi:MAG TPA: FxLYD domain-containing protein [Flavisolibacter sp.]|nr:FxLYD domain-containing protein [Flavisolibacter sp.]
MQKVYLLLRSNQQTGPFSLEELLQFDLKPYDLIWIEGRSAGWYYPQEIPALQPHLSFLKQSSTPAPIQPSVAKPAPPAGPKKIFVSMPSNPVKEEPTPKPSFFQPAYSAETPAFASAQKDEPDELKTNYARSLNDVETDYTNWVYQNKTKTARVSAKGVLVACLLAVGVFAAWALLQPADKSTAANDAAQKSFVPSQNELPADTVEAALTAIHKAPLAASKQKQDRSTVATAKKKPETATSVTQESQRETFVVNEPVVEDEAAPVVEETRPAAEAKNAEPVTAEAPKEKKKLRDKIADLFRKKPEKEEAKPVEEAGGERRAVRREAGSNLAQMVTVRFEIPNDWMMGIKGAKASLKNNSSETIVKAVVEVVYYNDDGDQLDKRTISFSNIKSKQTQTVSVPDHQTATRLEYNVVSATGNEPFAKR